MSIDKIRRTRKTYMVEDHIDRQIEVVAAVEGKTKTQVVDEAFQLHIKSKSFLRLIKESLKG